MIPLLILGLVYQNPGSSGYDLLSLMKVRHYKYIINVTKGSFYYNLQQLEDKEFIFHVAPNDVNHREARHYQISDAGIAHFNVLMAHYGSVTDYVNLTLYGPLLFADVYDTDKLKQLIQTQIEQTQSKIDLLEISLRTAEPSYFTKMLANSQAHHRVNIEWFQSLLDDLH